MEKVVAGEALFLDKAGKHAELTGHSWDELAPEAGAILGGFTAQPLLVTARVTRAVHLREHHGAALRGAFFGTLRSRFCVRQELTSCQPCTLHAVCPISALVATVDDASRRGLDVPRPFSLRPPVPAQPLYSPGAAYRFGLTLFGRALDYLPYTLIGLQDFGTTRFGARSPDGREGAGHLCLERVDAWNPLSGGRHAVYRREQRDGPESAGAARADGGTVRMPGVPVTHGDVLARAVRWLGQDRVTLRLLTPLRLEVDHRPVRRLSFGFLLRRLVDRLEALALHYTARSNGAMPGLGAEGAAALGTAGEAVAVVEDHTRWEEVQSFSARQGQYTPLGGLVGEITFGGLPERLAAFLPWLVWGAIVHAGKDTTRGNGWYRMVEP